MLDATMKAVETVCAMDPSIDQARLRDGLRVMAGELSVSRVVEAEDRSVKREEAAKIMGVCPQTISLYGKRGVIRAFRLGAMGERASGYSLKSIKEAMA